MDYTDDEIRKLMDDATPGPWAWFGNTGRGHGIYLATIGLGRRWVMTFRRWGMSSAAPMFQLPARGMVRADELVTYERTYRKDISGIDHPDARLIAAAPTLASLLLSARAELAAVREALDAAGAPLTVERGGPGPDSGDEVEATTADRVRWLAEECAGLWLDLRERPAGALGALREARPDTRIEVLYHPHADPGDGSGWVCTVGDRNHYGDNTLAGALAAAVRAECGE